MLNASINNAALTEIVHDTFPLFALLLSVCGMPRLLTYCSAVFLAGDAWSPRRKTGDPAGRPSLEKVSLLTRPSSQQEKGLVSRYRHYVM
jgi:hypothetical protein